MREKFYWKRVHLNIEFSVIWEMKIIWLNWPDMRKCQSAIYNQEAYHQNRTDYEFFKFTHIVMPKFKVGLNVIFPRGWLFAVVPCRANQLWKHGKFDNFPHLFCYIEYTPEYLHFFRVRTHYIPVRNVFAVSHFYVILLNFMTGAKGSNWPNT